MDSKYVRFEATSWTMVFRTKEESSGLQLEAMEELCRHYWYPLFAFLRSRGHATHDAEDLTQGYFAELANGRLLSAANPEKGRFRTLLLTGLKRYAANVAAHDQAWKRGGRAQIVAFNQADAEERWQIDAIESREPDAMFDRAWAFAIMESALDMLREEYAGAERQRLFDSLSPRLTGHAPDGETLQDVGERLGLSEAAVKMALSRMRKVFAHSLRAAVARTVDDEAEIQDELRYLLFHFQ